MPQQELFFERRVGERTIEVIKTYDRTFAREAFDMMEEAAQTQLWQSLDIEQTYDVTDIPTLSSPDRADFLWEELLDAAREDGSLLSFFVVAEVGRTSKSLYVSPDWPSAEAFAKSL